MAEHAATQFNPADDAGRKARLMSVLRRTAPEAPPLPELSSPAWIHYPDRIKQFSDTLAFVGGTCVHVPDMNALREHLLTHPPFMKAALACSVIPEIGEADLSPAGSERKFIDVNAVDDPHDLAMVDFAVLPGRFAVAENGAVWVDDRSLRHRAIYFIVQHLALVVPTSSLIDHMHAAYDRLTFESPGFGVFLSGPSKTADIEQSLVIGAHGPRSHVVYLVDLGADKF
ncbi:MAG TPA: LUD domain-containing protein [Pirellulales bacterium]